MLLPHGYEGMVSTVVPFPGRQVGNRFLPVQNPGKYYVCELSVLECLFHFRDLNIPVPDQRGFYR